jgi:eukaryotic-like serine/threonine-protein kinase
MKVSLTVIEGPGRGTTREFVEPRTFIIGRAPDCDFQLPPNDPYVSRQHVYLEICPPECRVRDLGSGGGGALNSPGLNGQPVTEAALKDGDVLELGYTRFRIGITQTRPKPLLANCEECRKPIEYLPGEGVPARCPECANRRRVAPATSVSIACGQCGCDVSAKANSDGRAQELAGVAHYRCDRCLPVDSAYAGKSLGSYRLVKQLGAGGMGAVYLVYEAPTARLWALKQMKDLKDAALNKRFERGMRLHKDLTHANVIRCIETGLDAQNHPYLVTEYVAGGELGATVDAGARMSPRVAVPLIAGVLDGLQYLHSRKIIHRDLKPQNVLLDRSLQDPKGVPMRSLPVPRIADFDLARCYGLAGGTRLTKLNTAMGTLMYMPPEQVRNSAAVKESADLYAVGVMLYYLLTGRYSFNFPTPAEIREMQKQDPEKWKSPEEAMRMILKLERIQHPFRIILNEEPTPIRERDASIPEKLAGLVDRAVKKDPAQRFQDAAEFQQQLTGTL